MSTLCDTLPRALVGVLGQLMLCGMNQAIGALWIFAAS